MSALSLTGARWATPVVDTERVHHIAQHLGLGEVAATCLAQRVPEDLPLDDWLEPSLDHLHDPFAMLHMEAAVDRLSKAVRDKQRVRIITDYDVDGTTSSLILQATLRILGSDLALDYHIPNRFDEGYGFSKWAAQQAAEDGVDLVVTADIGVRDHVSVSTARSAGVDVLVCDHHLPRGASVPEDATVLCPPQQGDPYPNRSLAACGVSLKLAQAMLARHPKRHAILQSLLKLAAVGTVADLVPLSTLENRAIVALGLRNLNDQPHHAGLRALLDVCRLRPGEIRESDLGFRVGPRINAAGRVADAKMVVELLNCRDVLRAESLAKRLDTLNRQRRELQARVLDAARESLGDAEPDPFVVVAGREDEGWHRGVVGIVASRLKDDLHRPCAVVSIQGDNAVGSVRSISAVHAVRALDSVSDLLVKYGGHPAAAGFTVPTNKLEELRLRLGAYVLEHATAEQLVPQRRVDAEVELSELSAATHQQVSRLGPFGMGNPRPQLVFRGVVPESLRTLSEGAHLKFLVPTRHGRVEALWWGKGDVLEQIRGQRVDVLGKLGVNTWKGRRTLQLELVDLRLAP